MTGTGLRYAYNTNGLANHRLNDAVDLLADSGYDGVALTLDIAHLDPFGPDLARQTTALRSRLGKAGLGCVVETGARFLLDPRAKHEPTLVTPEPEGRARRIDFLVRAATIGADLGAEALSFWAGVPRPGVDRVQARQWLVDGVRAVLDEVGDLPLALAFEPEPGMLIETCAEWAELAAEAPGLDLALDTGHCLANGEGDPQDLVRRHADDLGTVAVEGMRRGVHEHLPLDEGDMDLPAVLGALRNVGYPRLVCVELSRDSHRADRMVPAALEILRRAEAQATRERAGTGEQEVSCASAS
jgi:ribosomal protein S12 methylthiotransferase accessory factor